MPHPLSEFVLAAFTPERPCHDVHTIAPHLSGATHVEDVEKHRNVDKAYLLVAEDVLGCLREDGRLELDPQGWHVLAGSLKM